MREVCFGSGGIERTHLSVHCSWALTSAMTLHGRKLPGLHNTGAGAIIGWHLPLIRDMRARAR
eukprot:9028119-Pyramimonas_sp.AAC.1